MTKRNGNRISGRWSETALEALAALILLVGGLATLAFVIGLAGRAIAWAWDWN